MSINPIDQSPVRISISMSVTRQTPKTDFGDRMKQGLDSSAGIVVTLDDLVKVLDGVRQHYALHPAPGYPSILAELASLRAHAQVVASRAKQATLKTATTPWVPRP
jgi:hypothetical protein